MTQNTQIEAKGQQLFLDCDGVLADFDAAFIAQFGHPPRVYEEHNGSNTFWRNIREEAKDFYRHLPLMSDARELYEAVAHLRPIILTGCPAGGWAEAQKQAWASEHFPGVPMITCMSKDKRNYCKPGDILIDDWPKYQDLWQGAGGTFILHTDAKSSIADLRALREAAVPSEEPVADGELRFRLSSAGVGPLKIGYTNWRGEYAVRKIVPRSVWFGSTEWHPEPQWLITAHDVEKGANRDFAMSGFASPSVAPVAVSVKDLRKAAFSLSCDEQFNLATVIAGNIGYNLTPENEHRDYPEATERAMAIIERAAKLLEGSSIIPATKGGEDEGLKHRLWEALRFAASRSVITAAEEQAILAAFPAALAQDTDGVARP